MGSLDFARSSDFNFSLGLFLLVAADHTYFSYASNRADSYALAATPWRAEYDRPLGRPLGPASPPILAAAVPARPHGQLVFKRQFESGTSVVLDLLARTVVINWEVAN